MPSLGQLSSAELSAELAAGLRLNVGPFGIALQSNDASLADQISRCYPDYELRPATEFAHAGVSVKTHRRVRKPWQTHGWVWLDDGAMFTDYVPGEALPYVEWGINWCVATRCHFYLMCMLQWLKRTAWP